jgi:hypothetical protein
MTSGPRQSGDDAAAQRSTSTDDLLMRAQERFGVGDFAAAFTLYREANIPRHLRGFAWRALAVGEHELALEALKLVGSIRDLIHAGDVLKNQDLTWGEPFFAAVRERRHARRSRKTNSSS